MTAATSCDPAASARSGCESPAAGASCAGSKRRSRCCARRPSPGVPFTNETGYAAVRPIRIAPDGSFLGVGTAKNTSIRVRGKLRGRRISAGKVELSVEHCSGSLKFTARRAGA